MAWLHRTPWHELGEKESFRWSSEQKAEISLLSNTDGVPGSIFQGVGGVRGGGGNRSWAFVEWTGDLSKLPKDHQTEAEIPLPSLLFHIHQSRSAYLVKIEHMVKNVV